MKLIGYANYDWEADGFWYALPKRFFATVQIDPTVIPRPGTNATFGMSVIGAMTFPGEFGYAGTALSIEDAFLFLMTRLNPLDQTPRPLRAQRNSGEIVYLNALLRIPAQDDGDDINTYTAHFIAADPYWTPLTPTTFVDTF